MQLHQVWLYKEPCLTGAGTTDDQNVLIPGILGILWPAGHGQPFCLRKDHVVVRLLIHIRLNILGSSP